MKTAVVTGAAQGVGRVTAELLARRGYRVVLTDLQPLDAQVAHLTAEGLTVLGVSGDIASEAFVQALAARVEAECGGADVLVNNAGISLIAPAEDTSLAQWQRVMAINLQGPFLLCQAFGKQMLAKHSGSIVNVASVAGLRGVINRSAYNASKHGLIGLTRTLAGEWPGPSPFWLSPTASSTVSACRWTAAGPLTPAGTPCVSAAATFRQRRPCRSRSAFRLR